MTSFIWPDDYRWFLILWAGGMIAYAVLWVETAWRK